MSSTPIAVLISGGLDSAILLGDALKRHAVVHPLFVRCGLAWEKVELDYLYRYLHALKSRAVKPLVVLDEPCTDLYGPHWSTTGLEVPGAESPDAAVYLPGRNVLLLSKALLWCHLRDVPAVEMGILKSNPFPDATPGFVHEFQEAVNRAVDGTVEVRLPFGKLSKKEVMMLGRDLPLEFSFSCIQPLEGLHCGRCNKCAERKHAFRDAKMSDPTRYAQ